MEEVLIALLGIVVEIVVESLAWLPWDALLWWIERRRSGPGQPFERPLPGVGFWGAVVGLVLGALSLVLWRETMLPNPWLRVVNLAAAPTLAAALAHRTAQRRSARGHATSPRHHSIFAFSLTLMLVVVRFVFAVRPQ